VNSMIRNDLVPKRKKWRRGVFINAKKHVMDYILYDEGGGPLPDGAEFCGEHFNGLLAALSALDPVRVLQYVAEVLEGSEEKDDRDLALAVLRGVSVWCEERCKPKTD
jgi:hypothetical protein